jgi:hypothetical protein
VRERNPHIREQGPAIIYGRRLPMNDRPCVIMEERRNSSIGEQRAVIIWRRKDNHRDNPVTIKERKSLIRE